MNTWTGWECASWKGHKKKAGFLRHRDHRDHLSIKTIIKGDVKVDGDSILKHEGLQKTHLNKEDHK